MQYCVKGLDVCVRFPTGFLSPFFNLKLIAPLPLLLTISEWRGGGTWGLESFLPLSTLL